MARTRHIAGVLGLYASNVGLARLPAEFRQPVAQAAVAAAAEQRAMGSREDRDATAQLAANGMTIREIDNGTFLSAAEQLWVREAQAFGAVPWLEAIRA
jgi:TRAP-type C4-dicarboxylate transport system substrate-binding protein